MDRKEIVNLYLAEKPTAVNSIEIIKEIAIDLAISPNLIRKILTEENVIVMPEKTEEKAKRVSKADAHSDLIGLIESYFPITDEHKTMVSKLTGKCALFFKDVIERISNEYDKA